MTAWAGGTGAVHLIAVELALKIVQKINARERFMAYIVVPLYPEGEPLPPPHLLQHSADQLPSTRNQGNFNGASLHTTHCIHQTPCRVESILPDDAVRVCCSCQVFPRALPSRRFCIGRRTPWA